MVEVELGTCGRCRQTVYLKKVVNLVVACDPTPLEADEALSALLGGEQLWRLTLVGSTPSRLSPARPAVLEALRGEPPATGVAGCGERPVVLREHPCGSAPVYRPLGGSTRKSVQPTPPGPSVGRTAPSSGPRTGSRPVRDAVRPTGRAEIPRPVCDTCGMKCGSGTYIGVQLGREWLWVNHAERCKGE